MAVVDALRTMPVPEDSIFPASALAFLAGMAAFVVLWVAFPRPIRMYILGHELTHAVWGLMFGARVSDLKVGDAGGSVKLTKSNMLITLAPYFFPFYTMIVVLAALVVRLWLGRLPCPWAWMFLVGLTWCFHCCFTVQSLMQRQPDILEYGRVFSWTLIFIISAVGVLVWITVTAPLRAEYAAATLVRRVSSAYAGVFSAAQRCAELVADSTRGGG